MLQWSSMHNAWIFLFNIMPRANHSHFLPFPPTPLSSSLTYCTSFLIWATLLQPRPLCLHLIKDSFLLYWGAIELQPRGGGKGERDSTTLERKISWSQEMPCRDKTSLLCMPCETVQQYASFFVCVLAFLFVLVCSIKRKKRVRHTESACRCFDISCDLSAVSFWSLCASSTFF